MIKRILILGLFACSFLFANAAAQYMTIEQKDGKKYSFLLADKPVITYSDGNLVVNGSATTSYAISGVKNFHFTEVEDVEVKIIDANVLRIINVDDNTIRIENAPANARVTLSNLTGAIVFVSTANSEGLVDITLPNQKGIYIISVGNQSFKIIRE